MDPLHAWKDDFGREVDEVLASRARSQARGEGASSEGLGGRFSDLIIPPAGTFAELRDALKKLELASAEIRELRERLAAQAPQIEREREGRERMKDGAARLAFALRDERTARAAAEDAAKRASRDAVEAAGVIEAARLEAAHAGARAEDWEREALARLRACRELQERLDRALIDSDAKDAEAATLRARLEAAGRRMGAAEAEFAASRSDAASRESLAARIELARVEALRAAEAEAGRAVRAEASARTALARLAALEAEMRTMSASSAAFERDARSLIEEIAKVREEATGAQARERAAAQALAEERARTHEAAVGAVLRAEAQVQARLAGEAGRREAALEEERASLRARFEDDRARLEDELEAERATLRAQWKEQTEALERLRRDLERGRSGA